MVYSMLFYVRKVSINIINKCNVNSTESAKIKGLSERRKKWVKASRLEPDRSLRSWMMDINGGNTGRRQWRTIPTQGNYSNILISQIIRTNNSLYKKINKNPSHKSI